MKTDTFDTNEQELNFATYQEAYFGPSSFVLTVTVLRLWNDWHIRYLNRNLEAGKKPVSIGKYLEAGLTNQAKFSKGTPCEFEVKFKAQTGGSISTLLPWLPNCGIRLRNENNDYVKKNIARNVPSMKVYTHILEERILNKIWDLFFVNLVINRKFSFEEPFKVKFVPLNNSTKKSELLIECETINTSEMTEVSIYEKYYFPHTTLSCISNYMKSPKKSAAKQINYFGWPKQRGWGNL